MGRAPSPRRVPLPQTASRTDLTEAQSRMPTPKPHLLNGSIPHRPASPAGSLRDRRPPSIVVPPPSATFQHNREPSNATDVSTRIQTSESRSVYLQIMYNLYTLTLLESYKRRHKFRIVQQETIHRRLRWGSDESRISIQTRSKLPSRVEIKKRAYRFLILLIKSCSNASF